MRSTSTPILLRLASNASWLFLERAISIVVTAGVGFYFVRYVGPTNYGLYNYALGLYTIFAMVGRLGINALVVSETVQHGPRQSRILGSVFAMRMAASLLCALLLNATAYFIMDARITREITLVMSIGLLFVPFETITHWFEANVEMRPVAMARSLTVVLAGLGKLALIFTAVGLLWFAWLIPLELFLTSALLLYAYHQRGLRVRDWGVDPDVIRKFIREGTALFLSGLAVVTYMRIDKVLLGVYATPEQLGLYSAAVGISEMFYFIPVVLGGVLFPYLIKANKRGEQLFQQTFQLMCDGFAGIALIIAALATVFAVPIVRLAFGPEYLPSSSILAIHVWSCPFVFLEALRVRWFVIHQETRIYLITTGIGAVINVLLNLYLIPSSQGYGAAISTTLSYSAATLFSCFIYRRTWIVGRILAKSLLAPLRMRAMVRGFGIIREAVDGERA